MTKIIDPPGDDDGSGPKPGDDNPTNPGHNNPESGFLHIYAMLNTCWHQKSPFNNSVTVKTRDGRICPIGCTTIAALQILTRNKDVSLPEYFGITSSSWNKDTILSRNVQIPGPSAKKIVPLIRRDYFFVFGCSKSLRSAFIGKV